MSEVQAVVLANNIYLDQPGEAEAVRFERGETALVERAHAEAILASDEQAERDPRLTIVEAPKRRGRPPKATMAEMGVSDEN